MARQIPKVEVILKRYNSAMTDARVWFTGWQELLEYIMPRKSVITTRRTPGTKQMQKVFDSTVINSNELLGASIAGTLTSSSIKWFRTVFQNEMYNSDKDSRDWLDRCDNKMYAAIAHSNFDAESLEAYYDLGSIGICALFVEEADPEPGQRGFPGLNFKAFAPGEYVLDEGKDGRVNTIYRKFQMSAQAAYDKWGATSGEKVIRDATDLTGDPNKLYDFLHAIYPREKRNYRSYSALHMKYASCYVNMDEKIIVGEGGYSTFPVMVPRWAKTSGEKYGRGPGHTALPDVQTLNETIKMVLKAGGLAIQPPTVETEDTVVQGPKLTPGGRNVINGLVGQNFAFLESRAKFDVSQIIIADLRTNIRRTYFNDQLQLPEGQTIMTATEVERRIELMQRLLGPTLGRLVTEYLNPLIERIFFIMLEAGAFDEPPDLVIQMMGQNALRIVYEGPLARSQRASDLATVVKVDQIIGPWIEASPEILDNFDMDAKARYVAEVTGYPSKLMRSEEAVEEIRRDRAEKQAEAAKQQQMLMAAEAAGKAAPAMKAVSGG